MHLLPLFMFFLFIRSSNSENETAVYCTSLRCGDREVKYPFWVKNQNEPAAKRCGYQGFGLDCLSPSPSGKPDLFYNLSDEAFYVKRMDHQSITLSEVFKGGTNCPRPGQNLTIDETLPLDYTNLDFLTFYFNCTQPLPNSTTQFFGADCMGAGYKSYVSKSGSIGSEVHDYNWFRICEQKVTTAVTSNLGGSFETAMHEGFEVVYKREKECNSCEGSDGRCGFNNDTQRFVCFCKDGTAHSHNCKGNWQPNLSVFLVFVNLTRCVSGFN